MDHQSLSQICAESYNSVDFEEFNIEVIVRDNVFAFRGTDEPLDVVRDLRILPWWMPELGWVPAGFGKQLEDYYLNVYQSVWKMTLIQILLF